MRNQKLAFYPRLKCLACHLKRDPWIYARLNPWVPMFLAGEAFYARLNPEFWDPPLPLCLEVLRALVLVEKYAHIGLHATQT